MSLCLLFINNDLQCFVCGLGNIEQETAESKFVTKILFEKKNPINFSIHIETDSSKF